jgi:hypothetical protein
MRTAAIAAVQASTGAALAVVPAVLDRPLPALAAARPRLLVRVLGLRMLLQSALALACPRTLRPGAIADVVHSASMIATAIALPKYRTAAITSAAVAAGFAAANEIAGRQ